MLLIHHETKELPILYKVQLSHVIRIVGSIQGIHEVKIS